MPHGDFSDLAALTCFMAGLGTMIAPQLWFTAVGPMKPLLDPPSDDAIPPASALAAVRFGGGLLVLMAPILFMVRWNVLNGKGAGLGFLIAAANSASIGLSMDDYTPTLRPWYLLAAFFVMTALHLAFNANPMLTSAMLLEKEKAKAEKEKSK